MFDAYYCSQMKPLIKLYLIFVGCFLLLPLLIAAAIYVSSAFGYCYSYSMEPLPAVSYIASTKLVVNSGVTAILGHSLTPSQTGFKVYVIESETPVYSAIKNIGNSNFDHAGTHNALKSEEIEKSLTVAPAKPLFPCSRLEGSLDLSRLRSVEVESAGIMILDIESLSYDSLAIDTANTVSALNLTNVTCDHLAFSGTGSLLFSGSAAEVYISAASSVVLDLYLRGGPLSAEITGDFQANLTNFSSVAVTTVTSGAEQHICVAFSDVRGHCVSTLNKYWSGDSGAVLFEDGVERGRYSRYKSSADPRMHGTREKDVLVVCFADAESGGKTTAENVILSLDNRGEALVYVYIGAIPEVCRRNS